MKPTSWHMDRRTYLRNAAGVALSLPFLDCMRSSAGASSSLGELPKRLWLGSQHDLAHGAGKPGGFPRQGRWNQCLMDGFARFLTKMASTPEGDGSMLDNNLVIFGTSNSRTHNNHNYPLVLAGGANMGLKHDQCHVFNEGDDEKDKPMSNPLFTLLNRMGVSDTGFADSTGDLPELYA